MTYEQFELGMTKLRATYSERQYPPSRVDIIYERVQLLSVDRWLSVVSILIGRHRSAPMVDDILKAMIDTSPRQHTTHHIGSCFKCNGYGSYDTEKNGVRYGYQCFCEAGAKLAGGLPREK